MDTHHPQPNSRLLIEDDSWFRGKHGTHRRTGPDRSLRRRRRPNDVGAEDLEAGRGGTPRQMAAAWGLEFVDVRNLRIQSDLFRRVPFDLMLRYGFVPEERSRTVG